MLAGRVNAVLRKRKGVALGVWGEAGIGKSHAVQELLASSACRSLSLHATSTLATLAESVPTTDRQPAWARQALARLARRELIEEAGASDALVATLAAAAPFLLHLEDVHEADDNKLEFIRGLAGRVQRSKGVGLIVTSRVEPPEPFQLVRLEPLSKEAAADLVEKEMAARLPEGALDWIHGKARGNPLYTREYLRFVTQKGHLWNDGKDWHWREPERDDMPGTIEVLIEHQLEGVEQNSLTRYVLESKAILPYDVSPDVWQSVARVDPGELRIAKENLSRRGLFRGDDFAHPLFREVAFKKLSPHRRRDLSRRAVTALATVPTEAALFVADAQLEAGVALDLLKRAAQQTQQHNEIQAATFLALAADHAQGQEKHRLELEAAKLFRHGDLTRAVQLAERVLAVTPHSTIAIDFLAELYATLKLRDRAEQVLKALPPDEKEPARLLPRLVRLYSILQDHHAVLDLVERHPDLLETDDADTLYDVTWSMVGLGRRELAEPIVTRALTLLAKDDHRRTSFTYVQAVMASQFDGNDADAERLLRECLIAYRSEGRTVSVIAALHAHATTLEHIGRYREALSELEEAAKLSARLGNTSQYAETNLAIADQLRWCGDYERAEALYLDSLAILRNHDDPDFLLDGLTNLVSLYKDWTAPYGPTLALKYAREAFVLAETIASPRALVSATCALSTARLLNGDRAEAARLAEEASRLAQTANQEMNARVAQGEAQAALDRHDAALELLNGASDLAHRSGRFYQEHLIDLEIDRLRGNVEGARKRMDWFEERGLLNGVNLTKRYFPDLDGTTSALQGTVEDLPRLDVLGVMQLSKGPATAATRGRKRQALLARLLESRIAGRSEVGRLALLDGLYSDSDEAKALNSVKQLVHALRLEWGENTILTTPTGYALGAVTSDAERFLRSGDTTLWRGTYLAGLDPPMHESVAESLYHQLYRRARALLPTEPKETARVARFLIEYDPYSADYLALCVQALRASGNHRTLERLYDSARQGFLEVGEVLPGDWTAFLEQRAGR